MQLLTKQEAADKIRIGQSGLNKLIGARKIPYVKIGRLVRFNEKELEKWITTKSIKTA